MDSQIILDTTIDLVSSFSQQLKYSEPDLLQALTEWKNTVSLQTVKQLLTMATTAVAFTFGYY